MWRIATKLLDIILFITLTNALKLASSATLSLQLMTSYVTSCSNEIGGFRDLSCLSERFVFLSGLFFWIAICMQNNWLLLMFRSHIQLPWGQGHARSRILGVFVAHFSRYKCTVLPILSLGIILHKSKMNARFEISAYE